MTIVDPPTSTGTYPLSINSHGDTAGFFNAGARQHGFVRQSDGTFDVFEAPSGGLIAQIGWAKLNDKGDVAGNVYSDKSRGYVRLNDGAITVFELQNASNTYVEAINNKSEVAGRFIDASQGDRERGFLRDAAGGLLVFDVPDAPLTRVTGLNDHGELTGFCGKSRAHCHSLCSGTCWP